MAKSKKSLAETHPELAKEWHPTKNESMTPDDVTPGSTKQAWWKCDKGDDHEWASNVKDRARGRNCPICSGRKVVESNCLYTVSPEIAKDWHPTLNGKLTPHDFTANSHKKVWWKCSKGDDHEWESRIADRRKVKCPVCTGRKIVYSNSIESTHPEIAKQWHPTMNGNLKASEVIRGSLRKVWWKCDKGDDHEWETSILTRTSGSNCPVCSGKKVAKSNSLAAVNPELAEQWHPKLNKELTPSDVVAGSDKKVWWKCDEGDDHEWESSVANRTKGNGCPVCINRKLTRNNSLEFSNIELSKEWHPTLNKGITPSDFIAGSNKKVWWQCPEGSDHVWKSEIKSRNEGAGCPICSGKKTVDSNCLATLNPQLSKQWHQTLNGKLTPKDITPFSNRSVWWQCDKREDHVWKTNVASRSNGRNCPFCSLTPQSKQELLITFELRTMFKRINPKGFKTTLDGKLRAIDIFVPKLNLCIEFDGAYWHKGKREIDKIKSNLLLKEGYSVVRVREEPLKKIHDTDVISKKPYDGKQVTNDILSMILSMYDLNSELVQRIKGYQSKGELQNERGLNRYIDKILKVKAEKK